MCVRVKRKRERVCACVRVCLLEEEGVERD